MLLVCTSPVSLLLALLFLILLTFCALFEIAGLLHAFSMAQVGRRTDIWSMMMVGLRTCQKTLHPRNWLMLLFVIVLYPLTELITLSNIAYKLQIPSFIQQGIAARPLFAVSFQIGYLVLIFTEIAAFFSINIYVLQPTQFFPSCAESWALGRRHLLNTVLCMLLLSVVTNGLIDAVVALLFRTGTGADAVRQIIRMVFVPPIHNAGITALFYRYFEEKKSLAGINPYVFRTGAPAAAQKLALGAGAALLLAGSLFYFAHFYCFLAQGVPKPLVCAHRGDNAEAPDNSYEAFELAASEGLEWIELDVQPTADGVVVAQHNQTMKRRFGINRAVSELSYEELLQYTTVCSYDERYQNVHITTLKDVLLLAKANGMLVQIETKANNQDSGLEEAVLMVVEETQMRDSVMIISLFSDSIRRIRAPDADITAAHAVMLTWPDYVQVEDAGHLSAEVGTVTPLLVQNMHEAGKKVFCWTADDPADIQYLVSCGVDVIGTNLPYMVSEQVEAADCSGGWPRCLALTMHLLTDMERKERVMRHSETKLNHAQAVVLFLLLTVALHIIGLRVNGAIRGTDSISPICITAARYCA